MLCLYIMDSYELVKLKILIASAYKHSIKKNKHEKEYFKMYFNEYYYEMLNDYSHYGYDYCICKISQDKLFNL